MYNYRLKETTAWIDKLISAHESGTIIGLPMSGKLRTIESAFEAKNMIDQLLIIDMSVAPRGLPEFVSTIQPKIQKFLSTGGKVVYLENCSINSKNRRRQLKATASIRLEANRSFVYIHSFSEDISLKLKAVNKYKYLNTIQDNTYYFPYASFTEISELISQNSQRFGKNTTNYSLENIMNQTSGVPYLVKSIFRDGTNFSEAVSNFISEFTRHQIKELKNLTPDVISSYHKLGLLTSKGNFISTDIERVVDSKRFELKLLIDTDKQFIKLDNQSINNDLNSYEKEILFKLKIDNKISREEIATICYGAKKSADYSDYAIDKIMSRLRSNLINLGANPSVIKTKRGFGYSLNNGS